MSLLPSLKATGTHYFHQNFGGMSHVKTVLLLMPSKSASCRWKPEGSPIVIMLGAWLVFVILNYCWRPAITSVIPEWRHWARFALGVFLYLHSLSHWAEARILPLCLLALIPGSPTGLLQNWVHLNNKGVAAFPSAYKQLELTHSFTTPVSEWIQTSDVFG